MKVILGEIKDVIMTKLIEFVLRSVFKTAHSGNSRGRKTGAALMVITVERMDQIFDALQNNQLGAFANGLLPNGLQVKAATIIFNSIAQQPTSVT